MIYKDFKGNKISQLGFGCMRLPVLEDGSINTKEFGEMVDYALEHGINYFDTAQPYHNGYSQIELGKALKKHPRDSFYLATKYPGHQVRSSYVPSEIFERQLKDLGVEYFDFYLLHNVYEKSIETYEDPNWGIIDYFVEQKKLGRIKYLGFSSHARIDTLKAFVERHEDIIDFCQIQLNYLDWTLQDAKAKYEYLTSKNIPVWVMEPVRGGKLASFNEEITRKLKTYRNESTAAWAFRYLQGLDNVQVILSGMSNMEQMIDNINTFEVSKPLNDEELKYIYEVAESLKSGVPCTACAYCKEGCPLGLDIPNFMAAYNDLKVTVNFNSKMWIEFLDEDKKPSACIKCGQCQNICPQNIEVPRVLEELTEMMQRIPSWKDVSKQREEAEKKTI